MLFLLLDLPRVFGRIPQLLIGADAAGVEVTWFLNFLFFSLYSASKCIDDLRLSSLTVSATHTLSDKRARLMATFGLIVTHSSSSSACSCMKSTSSSILMSLLSVAIRLTTLVSLSLWACRTPFCFNRAHFEHRSPEPGDEKTLSNSETLRLENDLDLLSFLPGVVLILVWRSSVVREVIEELEDSDDVEEARSSSIVNRLTSLARVLFEMALAYRDRLIF